MNDRIEDCLEVLEDMKLGEVFRRVNRHGHRYLTVYLHGEDKPLIDQRIEEVNLVHPDEIAAEIEFWLRRAA